MHKVLTERQERSAKEIVDIAVKIHKQMGPGLLESVYEKCFCHELKKRNIIFRQQVQVPVYYDDLKIDDGLRLDLLIDESIVVELKAQENTHSVWEAQLLSYLKLTGNRLGFILNFHVPLMKDGIKRMIL